MVELTDDQMIECTSIAFNRILLGFVLGCAAYVMVGDQPIEEGVHRSRQYLTRQAKGRRSEMEQW